MSATGRLDSWKEIADYLRRSLRTAQRWEREAGLPVRRVSSDGGAVYAFRSEIDAWWQKRLVGGPSSAVGSAPGVAAGVVETPAGTHVQRRQGTRVQPFLPHGVRFDPDSAAGHASLAVYFFTLTVMGMLPPEEGIPAARAAAARALHLDSDNAEALALQGVVLALYDQAWTEAGRRFERALNRDPVPAVVQFHYAAWFLSPLQRHEECLVHLRSALVYEPLYLLGRVGIGCELCSLGRTEQGLAELEHVLRIDANFGPALGHLGREYALCGRIQDAETLAARTYASIPQHPNAVGFRAGMLAHAGDHHGAEQVLQVLAGDSAWSMPRARAEAHLVCGEFDAALDWSRRAIVQRDPGLWILFSGTAGGRLRERPAWPAVRSALGLPPTPR
jgi:tetratricopeptide (TPR) repeat protein